MTPVYLIFSHINPAQVVRLAAAIRQLSPKSKVVIHHDFSKSMIYTEDLHGLDSVYLIETSVAGAWGDFSQVEQYLHAFHWSRERFPEFDWLIAITGQSYPIRRLDDFESKLESSECDGFLYFFQASDPAHWPGGTSYIRHHYRYYGLPRFRYWHHVPSVIREYLRHSRQKFNSIQSLIQIMPIPKSQPTRIGFRRQYFPFPKDHILFGGRQNMVLGRRSVDYLLEFYEYNPAYVKYFRRTLNPDESFCLSILLNNKELRFVNDLPIFTKWPNGVQHASHCAVIESEDLPEIFESGKYFALKFDQSTSAALLAEIDRRLGIMPRTTTESSNRPCRILLNSVA